MVRVLIAVTEITQMVLLASLATLLVQLALVLDLQHALHALP